MRWNVLIFAITLSTKKTDLTSYVISDKVAFKANDNIIGYQTMQMWMCLQSRDNFGSVISCEISGVTYIICT